MTGRHRQSCGADGTSIVRARRAALKRCLSQCESGPAYRGLAESGSVTHPTRRGQAFCLFVDAAVSGLCRDLAAARVERRSLAVLGRRSTCGPEAELELVVLAAQTLVGPAVMRRAG
jgi:hypothetical protein